MARAGLTTEGSLRPVDPAGAPVYDNLYAAGAMLAGAEPWREKSGDGISLSTGYQVATNILEEAS
jgi:glycerol-3-phosphate dehydrogenase subunit B